MRRPFKSGAADGAAPQTERRLVTDSLARSLSLQITNESLPGVDLMIAIGVIIMVLGFLGCCGAIRENRCLLLMVRII